MTDDDAPDPWALLDSEVVCPTCRLTHHKHLPECPTCQMEDRK